MNWDIKVTKSLESRIEKTDFNNLAFGKDFTDHMFIADYYDGKWQDCRIVPFGNIELHPASFVLHYAQSIFEGLKAELSPNNDILLFRPDKNAERFSKSAERLAMPEVPKDLFFQSIQKLIEIDKEWIPKGVENASLYIAQTFNFPKNVQEIGTMNIFFVIDNVLITTALDEGTILNGVTRESLITLAKDFNIKVEERKVYQVYFDKRIH